MSGENTIQNQVNHQEAMPASQVQSGGNAVGNESIGQQDLPAAVNSSASNDFETRMKLLEQVDPAQAEYLRQMRFFEEANKHRLLMIRQEEDRRKQNRLMSDNLYASRQNHNNDHEKASGSGEKLNTPSGLPSSESSKSFWHTEPSPLLLGHRSTRELPTEADVVIVGSGITGASAAWHLLHQDKKDDTLAEPLNVVMLEAREACWGATGRNGGHCQPLLYEYPSDPSIAHFELANFATIQSLVKTLSIDCEFHAQSGVHAFYSSKDASAAEDSLSKLATTAPDLSSQMQFVTDKNELRNLRVPTAVAAIVTQTAARMWPYKFVAHILETLLTTSNPAFGRLNLQTHTPATSLHRTTPSTWTITTPRGAITTKKIILATNGYTSALLPSFTDLIVPCQGQMSALLPPPSLRTDARLTTSFGFIVAHDDYLIQRSASAPDTVTKPDGTKQVFQNREFLMFGGGRGIGPSLGVSDDSVIDEDVAKYLRTTLPKALGTQEKELRAVHQWTGIMGFSRDNSPFVGPVPGFEGVLIAAGYTGHGMPNAWLCGAAVAVMAQQEGDEEVVVRAAVENARIRLPRAYVLDQARLERVSTLKSVEEQDEMGFLEAVYAESENRVAE